MKAPNRWGRRVLRSDRLRRLLCWVIQLYIRFVYLTNRWSVEGGEIPRQLRDSGQAFILAFWHGRLLMIPMAWQRLAPMHMLISAHRDGRIIADAVTYFGVNSIAGSTRRGGSSALRLMLKQLAAGDCVGITPDGPRGPRYKLGSGAVLVSQRCSAPLMPVYIEYSSCWRLKSWDGFMIPKPFSKIVVTLMPYVNIPKTDTEEAFEAERAKVEMVMTERLVMR